MQAKTKNISTLLILLMITFTTKAHSPVRTRFHLVRHITTGFGLQRSLDLPLWEYPVSGHSDYFVILFSGDGGMKPIIEAITSYLNSKKIPIVVLNIQRYLWTEKKPSQIAADLEKLISFYSQKWTKQRAVIMGYSMGADILPFGINCIKPAFQPLIKDIVLIAPAQRTLFKIKLLSYVYDDNEGAEILPELKKIKNNNIYCICDDKKESLCNLPLTGIAPFTKLTGGHHFDGDYTTLTRLIGIHLSL
jgi:type IV secretory pathway VirJ component